MNEGSWWKEACVVFVLCVATGSASHAQVFNNLVNFNSANGANPLAALVQGTDGNLYGTTVGGGNSKCSGAGCGTVFRLTQAGTLTTLYSFCGEVNCADGANPFGGVVQAIDGSFYGTTERGGAGLCAFLVAPGCGTFFKMTRRGTLTSLHSFCAQPNCSDGLYPASLLQGIDGNFYGTTLNGGDAACNPPYGCGTIFKVTREGMLTVLHVFEGVDGVQPGAGGLVEGIDGSFYGTTDGGGPNGFGTIFRITASGKLTTLYSFDENIGRDPEGALLQTSNGALFGTTVGGGAYNAGTVFKLDPKGKLTTLYSFCAQANCLDGQMPFAGLVHATDGNFYGTTNEGGTYGLYGTVFEVTQARQLISLHSFNNADGANPVEGMVQATGGSFYGTTYNGGDLTCGLDDGCGTIFKLDMGLSPFVTFVRAAGRVGQTGPILGQGFTGTTSVTLNGTPASFTVVSDTLIKATVPVGATTGYVTVTTPSGTLTSNVPFHVIK